MSKIKLGNQFTDQLLEIDVGRGTSICKAGEITAKKEFYLNNRKYFCGHESIEKLHDHKATLICLLAAISDEDLIELGLTGDQK